MNWKRTDSISLIYGTTVTYEMDGQYDFDAQIRASQNGVSIVGNWPPMKRKELIEFEDVLFVAKRQYQKIASPNAQPNSIDIDELALKSRHSDVSIRMTQC